MIVTDHWYDTIASESHLPADAARKLRDNGFVVLPGPVIPGGPERLSHAYDRAVTTSSPSDVHQGRTAASTRVENLVNAGPEFDSIYIYPPLLAACCQIVGRPFRLSGMRARTLHPGAPAEMLHVDVKHKDEGWPLVGCIVMVDAFTNENGATRFIPGTHLQTREPGEVLLNPNDSDAEQVFACGPAGSMIVFNASVWHGYSANKSSTPRRSIAAHFSPRETAASPGDPSQRIRPETLLRIGDMAKYILNVGISSS